MLCRGTDYDIECFFSRSVHFLISLFPSHIPMRKTLRGRNTSLLRVYPIHPSIDLNAKSTSRYDTFVSPTLRSPVYQSPAKDLFAFYFLNIFCVSDTFVFNANCQSENYPKKIELLDCVKLFAGMKSVRFIRTWNNLFLPVEMETGENVRFTSFALQKWCEWVVSCAFVCMLVLGAITIRTSRPSVTFINWIGRK